MRILVARAILRLIVFLELLIAVIVIVVIVVVLLIVVPATELNPEEIVLCRAAWQLQRRR